jgi:hypothetical protein
MFLRLRGGRLFVSVATWRHFALPDLFAPFATKSCKTMRIGLVVSETSGMLHSVVS